MGWRRLSEMQVAREGRRISVQEKAAKERMLVCKGYESTAAGCMESMKWM